MRDQSKSNKLLYEHYKTHGICVKCGTRWNAPGHVLCEVCREKARVSRARSDPDKTKQRERQQALREYRREHGLCIDCGRPAVEGRRKCKGCLQRARNMYHFHKIRDEIRENIQNESWRA